MGLLAILIIFVWAGPLSTTPIVLIKKGFIGLVQFQFEFEPNPRWDNAGYMHFDNVDWINLTLTVTGLEERKVEWATLQHVHWVGTEATSTLKVFEFSVETGFLVRPVNTMIIYGTMPNAAGRHSLTYNVRVAAEDAHPTYGATDFYNHEYIGDPENTLQDFVRDSTWSLRERGTIEKYFASFSPLPIIIFSIISLTLLKKKKKGEQNV